MIIALQHLIIICVLNQLFFTQKLIFGNCIFLRTKNNEGRPPGRCIIPPHQGSGAGIAIKGDVWVSGWYPAATELNT